MYVTVHLLRDAYGLKCQRCGVDKMADSNVNDTRRESHLSISPLQSQQINDSLSPEIQHYRNTDCLVDICSHGAAFIVGDARVVGIADYCCNCTLAASSYVGPLTVATV